MHREAYRVGNRAADHPGAGRSPGRSPAGSEPKLIGLYLQSRDLHFRVAVHDFPHRCTRSIGGVFTCLRTAGAAE
jgi:hypothetical protein